MWPLLTLLQFLVRQKLPSIHSDQNSIAQLHPTSFPTPTPNSYPLKTILVQHLPAKGSHKPKPNANQCQLMKHSIPVLKHTLPTSSSTTDLQSLCALPPTRYCQCQDTTSISVQEPSVFLSTQEFATPCHPLFMTASHSTALRCNLNTHSFQSAFTILITTQPQMHHDSYRYKLALYIYNIYLLTLW